MNQEEMHTRTDEIKKRYPNKFAPEEKIFRQIRRGDRIFVGTGCGGPQYLIRALINYVEAHPLALATLKYSRSGPSGWLPTSMKNSAVIFGITVSL